MVFEGRIVWLFREPRSGGTWLASYLCEKLNRKFYFPDFPEMYGTDVKFSQRPGDEELLINTHYFNAVNSLPNYNDPVIIRYYRQDTLEQFLSSAFSTLRGKFTNINSESDRITFEADLHRIANSKFEVTREYLDEYLKLKESMNFHWNSVVHRYESYDVSYEDLVSGCDLFGLGKITMENFTEKLPENYKEIAFLNYNEVKNWII